ncbi:MAG: adenylyl-sulfate kinase [Crocinitomicaceae bacterium]
MTANKLEQGFKLSKSERQQLHGHASFLVWFTGLSGAGKSTLSEAVERKLHSLKISTFRLDGDNLRSGINADLGFSAEDRVENIRRASEISKLFIEAGHVVLGSFISPYRESRAKIRSLVGEENYLEIYMSSSLENCEERDIKGLYKKARSGEILQFTGISAPYEAPEKPDLEINIDALNLAEAVDKVLEVITPKLALK